ncbi:MAG: valine--tRNA ligase [Candidatus Methanomethylicota archaeon]|uniref:Valine--tRNA ligase n=1 Tax=Thermoproteota archaeon TaxID=2056631 RepID=A0A523BAE6_9CREN|nr:MAG: valine--tRNA ligase [Candidatus Verstraetearchaeota archaeon]
MDPQKGMEKTYSPQVVEERWQRLWLTEEYYPVYKFKNDERPKFVIDTPPPFTSGELHMGHAYWNILNDTLARYKRMRGFDVLLPQGWDCQGLPTELKVQYKWKVPRENRELFRKKCSEWTNNMIKSMKEMMIKLGYRPDWEQFEYRTMDREYWKAVQLSLLIMYQKGLVYRKEFPVHWCSKCGTALAQAELGYVQKKGKLHYVKFRLVGSEDYVEVATTRPELLNACVALLVHPLDERYLNIVGREVEVPIFGQKVRILQDEEVDPKFGTGVVMVCTYGDEQDIKWQQSYGLPIIRAIDECGKMINAGRYTGKSVVEAREEIVKDLKEVGLISREEDVVHNVLTHTERADCMTPIEFLVKEQWFLRSKEFKEMILEETDKMKWMPKFMRQRLIDWVNSIEWDWLISRQRVFGTPIPFWYCRSCNYIIPPRAEDLPVDTTISKPPIEVCPKCGSTQISGTPDVCDCWVDSSITPLVITGFFTDANRFKKTYPVDVRQQGHDIIRTWLYYTVLRCKIITGEGPFKGVLVNGHILGPDGSRMSKSKGNVIMPEEGIRNYGADAIRQAVLSLTLGSDFPFKWEPVKYGKAFNQKVWSSVRFACGFLGGTQEMRVEDLEDVDRWILSRLREVVKKTTEAMEEGQFHIAVDLLQRFYWHDFCDQYIEAVKPRLYTPRNTNSQEAAKATLYKVIWTFIRMMAPICPHITEEIYHKVFKEKEGYTSIHAAPYPMLEEIPEVDGKDGGLLIEVIADLRSKKVENKIPLSAKVKQAHVSGSKEVIEVCKRNDWLIREVLHIDEVEYVEGEPKVELAPN